MSKNRQSNFIFVPKSIAPNHNKEKNISTYILILYPSNTFLIPPLLCSEKVFIIREKNKPIKDNFIWNFKFKATQPWKGGTNILYA